MSLQGLVPVLFMEQTMEARTERSVRFEATSAAHEAIVEKAAREPQKIVDGMVAYPHFISEFSADTLGEIVAVLLEKGYRARLLEICESIRMERWARTLIVNMALFN
jgi:hypothetical protein